MHCTIQSRIQAGKSNNSDVFTKSKLLLSNGCSSIQDFKHSQWINVNPVPRGIFGTPCSWGK
jgi:hypothetical protein